MQKSLDFAEPQQTKLARKAAQRDEKAVRFNPGRFQASLLPTDGDSRVSSVGTRALLVVSVATAIGAQEVDVAACL